MPNSPRKEFNSKAKTYLYSVSVRAKGARNRDFSEQVKSTARKLRALAADEGYGKQVQVKCDDGSLNKAGIFYMNAPERFAAKARKVEGIHAVQKPSDRKAIPAAKKSGGLRH